MTEPYVAELDELPLAVDLDGTLLLTDVLHESCLQLLRNRPCHCNHAASYGNFTLL